MIINNIFTNKQEEILKAINALPVYKCIENFDKYLDVKAEDEFERMYIQRLKDNIRDLARKVLREKLSNLEKEELLEELIEANIEAPYAFICYYDNNELNDFFENHEYNDVDAHVIIKDFMLKEYNDLVVELAMNAKEKRIDYIKRNIEEKRKILSSYEEDINRLESNLKEIETDI